MGEELVDVHCESYIVACRALWLLYLRGKWDLLRELQVERKEVEPLFDLFSAAYLGDRSRITTEAEVISLLRNVPELVWSLILMVGAYQMKVKEFNNE